MVNVTISLDTGQYETLAKVAEANGFGDLSMSQLISIRTDDEVSQIRAELDAWGVTE